MPAIQLMTLSNTEGTAPGTGKVDVKSAKLQGIQAAFSNYMQQNSSNTAQAAKQQGIAPQAALRQQGSQVRQQYEQYQGKACAQMEKAAAGQPSDAPAMEETMAAAGEAAAAVQEAVKEALGADDEQIAEAMELLGLTQADLLNPQNVIALCVQLTGSEDAGMMLFQENFQGMMQEISVITEDLLKDLGMTMEELMGQLENMQDDAAQTLEGLTQADTALQDAQPDAVQPQMQDTAEITQNVFAQGSSEPETAAAQEQGAQEAGAAAQDVPEVQPETVSIAGQEQGAQKTQAETQQNVQEQGAQEAQAETAAAQEQDVPEAQPETWQQEQSQSGQEEFHQDAAQERSTGRRNSDHDNPRYDFSAQPHVQQPTAAVQPQNLTAQAPLPQIPVQDVIEQIVEYTRVNLSEDVKSIEIQLNPESLGRVYLHVSEHNGTVTAQLAAQNESLKEALIQQAAILKENLTQQGIKVDAVEVTAGAHEFESNLERDARGQEEQARQQADQNARRSRRTINLNEMDDLDGLSGLLSDEEALAARIMRDNGNNVDYKA